MVGRNVESFPQTARKVSEAGHVIGNHAYSHRGPVFSTPLRVAQEINKAEEAIRKATSVSPFLFRPPYGAVGPRVLKQAEKLGYVVSQWSVNAGDWRGASPPRIVKKVLNQVRTRIGVASGEERADISRVFERVVAFCAPTGRPQSLN